MNSEQLEKIMQSTLFGQIHFGGVYPSDMLDEIDQEVLLRPKAFIFNMDPHDMPGSHWVAAVISKTLGNFYFDSYGYPPILEAFQNFLGPDYLYNATQLQHELSTTCGQWCIFFIWHRLTQQPLNSFTKRFDPDNKLKNDHLVNYWVEKTFDVDLTVIDKKFLHQQLQASRQMQENKNTPWFCSCQKNNTILSRHQGQKTELRF